MIRTAPPRTPRRLLIYAVGLNGAALTLFCVLVLRGQPFPPWWILGGLAAVEVLAERQSVFVTRNIRASVSFLPLVFAAVAFGPAAAFVVAALANLADLIDDRDYPNPYLRVAVYTPIRGLTGAAAGLAAATVYTAGDDTAAFTTVLLATLAAGAANHFVDAVFNVLTLYVRRVGSLAAYAAGVGPYFVVSLPLYVPIIALLAFGYLAYSIWIVAPLLAAGLALQRLLHLYQQQRDAARELEKANETLVRANLSFASALVAALDARDEYTAGHSTAVASYAHAIAARLGLSEQEQELAHVAGLVHDIGKIGLPPGLLEKVGPLTLAERRQMEQHSVIGERILVRVDDYAEVATIVRHHHERVDGHGYPDRLRGDEIPLLSRIIAVADAYDAMTSDRPYREAMPSRVARLRLAQAVASQFDTSVVAAFEALLASGEIGPAAAEVEASPRLPVVAAIQ